MVRNRLSLLLILLTCLESASAQEAKELLARYNASTAWKKSVDMLVQFDRQGFNLNGDVLSHTKIYSIYRRDGDRAENIMSESIFQGAKLNETHLERHVVGGQFLFEWEAWLGPDGTVTINTGTFSPLTSLRSPPGGFERFGYFDAYPSDASTPVGAAEPELLADEDVDGIPCRVIRTKFDRGEETLWIAPSKGYNIMKRRYELAARQTPKMRSSHEVTIVDAIKIEQFGSAYVVTAGQMSVFHPDEQNARTMLLTMQRSEIHLKPDFAALGAFKIKIPVGTTLKNPDERGVYYQWRGVDPVPVDDVRQQAGRAIKESEPRDLPEPEKIE